MSNATGLTQADLEKGLRKLEAAAAASTTSRHTELFQKAQQGTISTEEREELVKSLSGESTLASQATAALTGSGTIQKSLDVSDYLREQHKGVVEGLGVLASHMEKSEGQGQEFRVALATTLVQMGEIVKSLSTEVAGLREAMGGYARQPARAPKSQAATSVINKSFAGAPNADALSKAQIADAMSDMLEKGAGVVAGEDMLKAAVKYETTNLISPDMLAAVQAHVRGGGKAA